MPETVNVHEMTKEELWVLANEIMIESPEFVITEKTLKGDVHMWYHGELLRGYEEEKECECFQEYVAHGRFMLNPNMACEVCLDAWGGNKYK